MLVGNLFNTLVLCALMGFVWGLQRLLPQGPKLMYKFIASYGLVTVFDFFLLALVDLMRWVLALDLITRARTRRPSTGRCAITMKTRTAAGS